MKECDDLKILDKGWNAILEMDEFIPLESLSDGDVTFHQEVQ